MSKYGIPTAESVAFSDSASAIAYGRSKPEGSLVVKADGLAAGKGVILPDNYEGLDWIVEGNQIVTDIGSPMDVRYIAQITTTTLFLPLFRKALSAAIAVELSEQLTQSTSKLKNVSARLTAIIAEAKKQDAFEAVAHLPPADSWILARDRGTDNTRSFFF